MIIVLLNAPAGLLTALWALATWRRQAGHWRYALGVGFVAGLALALYGVSLTQTSVIRATMLFYLMPVWATLIGVYWLGERADWRRWVAIACSLLGLSILLWGEQGYSQNLGDVLAFFSGWAWAISTAMMKKSGKAPLAAMLCVQFISVALVALVIGALIGGTAWPNSANFGPTVTLGVLISIFGILPALVMIFWASQFLFPGRVGLLLLAEVVVAVISASIFLPEETLPLAHWGAVVLIVGAAGIEYLPSRAKPRI